MKITGVDESNHTVIKSKLFFRISILLLSSPFFIEVFYSFNEHHDGLILTTIRLTRESLVHGGAWPFNQYGQFWVFPYTLLTFWVPDNLLLISLRIVALICYSLTIWLLWKLSSLTANKNTWPTAIVILLASQPFFSGLGLLAWPSAIAMPLVVGVVVLVAQLVKTDSLTNRKAYLFSGLAGIIIPMIIGSRVQIGFLTLFIASFFVFSFRGIKALSVLWLSTLGFIAIFFVFLNERGWLVDSLVDQFKYGSLYVTSGTSTGYSSKPIYTCIGIFLFLTIFKFGKRAVILLLKKFELGILLLIATICGFMIYFLSIGILYSRNPSYLFTFTIISRRFWTSLILAGISYATIQQLVRSVRALKRKDFVNLELHKRNLLVAFSVGAIAQSLPLLDAFHTWWGSAPGFLVLTVVIKEQLGIEFLSIANSKFLKNYTLVFLLFFTLALDFLHFTAPNQKSFPNSTIALVRSDSPTVDSIASIQKFFVKNLKSGERVLNLCPNSDVFFADRFVLPASRIFVYWPNFNDMPEYLAALKQEKPDAIVYCDHPNDLSIDKARLEILNVTLPQRKVIGSWIDIWGYDRYTIWKSA